MRYSIRPQNDPASPGRRSADVSAKASPVGFDQQASDGSLKPRRWLGGLQSLDGADEWGTPEALTAIVNSEVPVLGIGEGGYAYFGQISLEIGYPNGGWSTGTSVDWENGDDDV